MIGPKSEHSATQTSQEMLYMSNIAQSDPKEGENDDNDKECDQPVHQRSKIDPDLFPWAVLDKIKGITLQDKCKATRDLNANYTINLKLAKAHPLNSRVAPDSGVP
jgi:hypothetical protein